MKQKEILETEVRGSYDVIVAGAGIAGAAAALASVRTGAKTLLLEKGPYAGGLATLGLVAVYLPLCDGRGRQVTFGIAEELLLLSGKYGFSNIPAGWTKHHGAEHHEAKNHEAEHHEAEHNGTEHNRTEHTEPGWGRYQTDFSPAAFAIAIDELLEEEGVEVLYDTLLCGCIRDGNRVTGICAENKSGRGIWLCGSAVDTTGDADLLWRAGVPTAKGDNGLSYWNYSADREKLAAMALSDPPDPSVLLDMGGARETGLDSPLIRRRYDGTKAEDVSDFLKDGRRCLKEEIYENGRRKDRLIMTLPGMAQFRTTRHILGDILLTEREENRQFEDSVGCIGDFRVPGPVWEIPYRALRRKEFPNLFTAGRSISAEGKAWQKTRVIPGAALTGQAAGTAAALCALGQPEGRLFSELEKQGVRRHV